MQQMFLTSLDRFRDIGLLILRLGWGWAYLWIHGGPKIFGGMERWEKLGGAMGYVGIDFAPAFWGFMASLSEFGGAILLALGLFFRPALIFMFITMVMAAVSHLGRGDNLGMASHAIENAIVFAALFLTGPGKYSLDEKWKK